MLNIVEVALEKNGFRFARLDGTMTQQKRQKALKDFDTIPGMNVFYVCDFAGVYAYDYHLSVAIKPLAPFESICVCVYACLRVCNYVEYFGTGAREYFFALMYFLYVC